MSHNVASNWFLGVCRKHGSPIHLCYHLVGYHHGNTKLLTGLSYIRVNKVYDGYCELLMCQSRCPPRLPAGAACAGSGPGVPVWPTARLDPSSLFCIELWHCPLSAEHTWHTKRNRECVCVCVCVHHLCRLSHWRRIKMNIHELKVKVNCV